jgi:hypothetical protein
MLARSGCRAHARRVSRRATKSETRAAVSIAAARLGRRAQPISYWCSAPLRVTYKVRTEETSMDPDMASIANVML